MEISECKGKQPYCRKYEILPEFYYDKSNVQLFKMKISNNRPMDLLNWIKLYAIYPLTNMFLPSDYPESVSEDYLSFQVWETIQGVTGFLNGSIANVSVMQALGVGNNSMTVAFAASVVIYQQLSHHLAKIFFSWTLGRRLDLYPRPWRLLADIGYNAGTLIRFSTAIIPTRTLIIVALCLSSVVNAFVSITANSIKLGIIHHQSRKNNGGEVFAKDINQSNFAQIITTLVVLWLLPEINGNESITWIIFGVLTFVHIACSYGTLRNYRQESLNSSRLRIMLKEYLKKGTIPSIRKVNQRDPIIWALPGFGITDQRLCKHRIRMGVSLKTGFCVRKGQTKLDGLGALKSFENKHFIITQNCKKKEIFVIFHEDVFPIEIIEAYVRAMLLAIAQNNRVNNESQILSTMDPSITESWNHIHGLISALNYDLRYSFIEEGLWRARWEITKYK